MGRGAAGDSAGGGSAAPDPQGSTRRRRRAREPRRLHRLHQRRGRDRPPWRPGASPAANGGLVLAADLPHQRPPVPCCTRRCAPDAFYHQADLRGALGEEQDRKYRQRTATSRVDVGRPAASPPKRVRRPPAGPSSCGRRTSTTSPIENELLNRETTLETLRGQRGAASGDQVALATITVTSPWPPTARHPAGGRRPPWFLDAFRGGWDALVKVGHRGVGWSAALVPWAGDPRDRLRRPPPPVRSRRRRAEAFPPPGRSRFRPVRRPGPGFLPPPPPASPSGSRRR